MLAFIANFLMKRFIKVRLNNIFSDKIEIENVVPQGSVISVILFSLAVEDIFAKIQKPAKGIMFADDLSILCKGNSLTSTYKILQAIL